jgi:2-isopropylmalate synthase
VDAVFSAVNQIVPFGLELEEYAVHAVSGGINALGEVTVRIHRRDEPARRFTGHGADTDIVVASARAYIAAVNKAALAAGMRPSAAEADAAADAAGPGDAVAAPAGEPSEVT